MLLEIKVYLKREEFIASVQMGLGAYSVREFSGDTAVGF
jgi:hypothetical protein